MDAWQGHRPDGRGIESRAGAERVGLEALGWRVVERRKQTGLWRDADGDYLGLVRIERPLGLPPWGDEEALERYGRAIADSLESRLVEAVVLGSAEERAALFVSRRLENWALVFTGILMVPGPSASWAWSMVAKGTAVTGDVRRLCEDCLCPAHPLWRVRHALPRLLGVHLNP